VWVKVIEVVVVVDRYICIDSKIPKFQCFLEGREVERFRGGCLKSGQIADLTLWGWI
jgi:hypothetical protein